MTIHPLLPTTHRNTSQQKENFNRNLARNHQQVRKIKQKRRDKKKGEGEASDADFISPSKFLDPTKKKTDSGVPEEFSCAINGHLMKEPVRTPDGIVFERATIELWLDTRGSICPITGNELTKGDLVVDANLQAEIVRFHIKKTNMDTGGGKRGEGRRIARK